MNPNGAPGVATVFSNGGDTREIGDTILVLPDAAGAATALKGATAALGTSVVGGTPAPASVGSDSVMVSGASPDGAKAVTVLLFTQGSAFVTLEFDSAAEDPVPPEFVLDVAGKQDQKITAGLGS
jgi:cyanophycinase-like exopeptidase